MKSLIFLIVLLVIAAVASAAFKTKASNTQDKPRRKRLLTDREQVMYSRLTQSLPDLHVLPQVAFSALLAATSRATRNTFDRKVADFVICDAAFQVQAVVELDDKSHKGRERQDAQRDKKLADAGYRVLRYSQVPDIVKVRADFAPPPILKKT
ncbi:MAG: DUF2726 domain-containing protein [Janthinobacterium lividum]